MSSELKLLLIETVLKLVSGGFLLLFPATTARVLGLSRTHEPFWPQLMGGTLIALAAASFLEGYVKGAHGLGLAGALVINFVVAATIATLLVLGRGAPTRRGRALLWCVVAVLSLLGFSELAVV